MNAKFYLRRYSLLWPLRFSHLIPLRTTPQLPRRRRPLPASPPKPNLLLALVFPLFSLQSCLSFFFVGIHVLSCAKISPLAPSFNFTIVELKKAIKKPVRPGAVTRSFTILLPSSKTLLTQRLHGPTNPRIWELKRGKQAPQWLYRPGHLRPPEYQKYLAPIYFPPSSRVRRVKQKPRQEFRLAECPSRKSGLDGRNRRVWRSSLAKWARISNTRKEG